jgi:hypothetical protein
MPYAHLNTKPYFATAPWIEDWHLITGTASQETVCGLDIGAPTGAVTRTQNPDGRSNICPVCAPDALYALLQAERRGE